MAFSFLSFILRAYLFCSVSRSLSYGFAVTVYLGQLATLATMYAQNGIPVWTKSVREVAQITPAAAQTYLDVPTPMEQLPMKTTEAAYETPAVPNVPYTPTTMHEPPTAPSLSATYVPTQYGSSNNAIQV